MRSKGIVCRLSTGYVDANFRLRDFAGTAHLRCPDFSEANMKYNAIKDIIQIMNSGGVAILPTDTVYGLFCRAGDKKAVKQIYEMKGRDFKKPLQVFFPDIKTVGKYAETGGKQIEKYLPGPYTLVLKLKFSMKRRFSFLKAGTVGARVIRSKLMAQILKKTGPLAATSANMSGGRTPVKFNDIPWELRSKAGICLINNRLVKGRASRVIAFSGEKPEILRS